MAMATDVKSSEQSKKRPSSAPKSGELIPFPKIIVSDRKETTAAPGLTAISTASSSPPQSSPGVSNLCATVNIRVTDTGDALPGATLSERPRSSASETADCEMKQSNHMMSIANHMPIRSSSDIGLPASSMPNLALQLGVSGSSGSTSAGNENHLGVYCSPRTSRRSVDLDMNNREDVHGQYEWLETLESSSNSLKVLTVSSRVGSALSLNSECTARSIGLLSNDSDSDNDVSLSEREKLSDRPSQLRRYMSHPEEGASPEVGARPSQSLSNLKSANTSRSVDSCTTPADVDDNRMETSTVTSSHEITVSSQDNVQVDLLTDREVKEEPQMSKEQTKGKNNSLPIKPSTRLPGNLGNGIVSHGAKERTSAQRRPRRAATDAREKSSTASQGSGGTDPAARSSRILSYKYETHDSSRDGRIRQWLQDMDKHTGSTSG